MKILVTGAKGFIGKNLIAELNNRHYADLFEYDRETDPELLDLYTRECDFVYHLAGVNRSQNPNEFMQGNCGFTGTLLDHLEKHNNRAPVLITSSIQADFDNPYGKSKKNEEDLVFGYGARTGTKVMVYRLSNVFGKWCKPNYNSVVATFCHNIANELPLRIDNPNAVINLVYIDDVVNEFIGALEGKENKRDDFCCVEAVHATKLGELPALLESFKESRKTGSIPNMADDFTKRMYSTFLSYLPETKFSYLLKMNVDNRGSFSEFIKTNDRGQVSVNISKPKIERGNHWHHTKHEKFLVVSGEGLVKFRKINASETIEYHVSGNKLEVVDIPIGYTHKIVNTGDSDMVTVMWTNEPFDPNRTDTYYLEV